MVIGPHNPDTHRKRCWDSKEQFVRGLAVSIWSRDYKCTPGHPRRPGVGASDTPGGWSRPSQL